MTARDVLDEIEQRRDLRMIAVPDVDAMLAALRAVLDIHRDIDGDGACAHCANWDESVRLAVKVESDASRMTDLAPEVPLPCPTVRAITDALSGVTTRTDR